MIYFDNAATSYPKPNRVIKEVTKCLRDYCGNPGRSSHTLSVKAADKIFETRETVTRFLGIKNCENVVFTPNATYALNMVIKGLIKHRTHCIVSDIEHNSVLRPLDKVLKMYGGTYSIFDSDKPLYDVIPPLIENDTEFIICTLCSNVTGKIINFDQLSDIAKANGLKLIIDASQYIGHKSLDLSKKHYTCVCSAGHKNLFGIQGSAFAVINSTDLLDTLTEGGSGIETFSRNMPLLLPERYEAGTLPTPAIASLNSGINFIEDVGIANVEKHLSSLTETLSYMLREIPHLKIYGVNNGIASFNINGYPSSYVAKFLDDYGIATRSGFHCAPLIHEKLNTTSAGTVRVSFSIFNTEKEIHKFIKVLKKI